MSVSSAVLEVIGRFIFYLPLKELLPYAVKLFPILLRKLSDPDLRVSKNVPKTIYLVWEASGDFLTRRIFNEFFEFLTMFFKKNSKFQADSFSMKYKTMAEFLRCTKIFFQNLPLDSGPIKKLLGLVESLQLLKFRNLPELEALKIETLKIVENNWIGYAERCV